MPETDPMLSPAALAWIVALLLPSSVVTSVLSALLERSGPIRLRHWAEEAGGSLRTLFESPVRAGVFRSLLSLAGTLLVEISLPSLRLALLQVALGAANWMLMAALIHLLLPKEAFYPTVLGILLISSIAGVITHIPAGLGVLEAVFMALMQHQFSKSTLLAALIGYRALYFLLPLVIAVVVYLVLEKRAKHLRKERAARAETREEVRR